MQLPALKLPQIELPFDIPLLLHPPIDHFAIAIPVLVLLIEVVNLFLKKRALGVLTFFLLILGMLAAVAAYLTGVSDGKETFDLLAQAGQEELKEHKLLGSYLVIASALVVILKMLSALLRKGALKALYLLVLVLFVVGMLKQGKEGGELVYEHGANVSKVKALDDALFDCKDELGDAQEEAKKAAAEAKKAAEALSKPSAAVRSKERAATTESLATDTNGVPAAAQESSSKSQDNKTPAQNYAGSVESTKEKVEVATKQLSPKRKEQVGNMEMPVTPLAPEAVKIETH